MADKLDRQQVFKEILGKIIKKKFSLYGKLLIDKISASKCIEIAPSGEIISINGDPKNAVESVLRVFKEISGNAGLASTVTALKDFSKDHPEVRNDVEEAVASFKVSA